MSGGRVIASLGRGGGGVRARRWCPKDYSQAGACTTGRGKGVGNAGTTAAELFAEVVADHVRRIEQRTPAAVADEPDGVHALRTGVRRLRNVLAVYRKVFDSDAVAGLRDRLADFGAVLGEARDLEVRIQQAQVVAGSLTAVESDLVEWIVRDFEERYRL